MGVQRLFASTLIGRAAELAEIREVLLPGPSGRPGALLISGEAGVGKTRLIREARREAPFDSWTNIETFALPDQGAPAYFATARIVARVARLATVDPALVHEVEAALQGTDASSSTVLPPPDEGRFRLLDAMVRLIESAARDKPILITFDDMQWASAADWSVAGHLIRTADAPLALVIAARDERLWHSESAALPVVLELNRERLIVQMPLKPLSRGEAGLLCQELTGAIASQAVTEAVFERTDGNPFLTEELLTHLLREGALSVVEGELHFETKGALGPSLPPTVRLATLSLLNSLDAPVREVLEVAAAIGRMFSVDFLVAAGCPASRTRLALLDAQSVGLVAPAGEDWTFQHDIIREAVLAETPATRRTALHHRIAEVLLDDNLPGAGGSRFNRLAAVVVHCLAAGERIEAFRAATEASRLATRAFAPDEALRYAVVSHECALKLATTTGEADDRRLTEALELRGDAEMNAGQYAQAEAHFEELLARATALGDERLKGQSSLRLGLLWRRREDPQRATTYLARALTVLEPIPGEGSSIARTLVELSTIEALTLADYGSAEEYASRALAMAEHLGDRRIEVEALIALGNTKTRGEGPRAARGILEEALTRAEAAGELGLALDTAAGLSNSYYWSGELGRAQDFGRKRLELATRAHDIFGLRHGHSWLALLACSRGEWAEALDLLSDAAPMLARLASPEPAGFIRVVSAFVHYRTGDNNRAYEEISGALTVLAPLGDGTLLWYGSLAALICLAAGRRTEAIEQMRLQERRLQGLPASALPARSARAALGLAYAEAGDRDGASRCALQLTGFEEDFHWSPVRRTLAKAAILNGDVQSALNHLQLAARQARDESQRPDLGLILLDIGLLLPPSDPQRMAALEEAGQIFDDLSMTREQSIIAPLLRRHRPSPAEGGLSPRELQVLRLIAEGCSNREIAARLVISERTAINHVSNILSKLGLDNRTAAAAYGLRHGFLEV